MASSSSSKDKHNFQCVTEASLELIKLPLKDILSSQIKPEDLFLKIKSSLLLSGRNKLRPDQLKLCYFPPPLLPNYSKFDVTLLYTLIRNLSSGLEPTRGWGNEPDPKDTKIGDDIERLRFFRNNNFAHLNSATIPDDTFDDLWRTLKAVLSRLKCHSGCGVDYEQELIEIKRSQFRNEIWEEYRNLWKVYLEIEKEANEREKPVLNELEVTTEDKGILIHYSFEVSKNSPPVMDITWSKNAQPMYIIDDKFSGGSLHDIRLVIKFPSEDDKGNYSCTVTNDVGSQTKHIVLDIPSVTLSVDSTFRYGSTAIVKANVCSTPLPERVNWQKSNDRISFHSINITKRKYDGSNDMPERPKLVISNISFRDKLYYRLVVSNKIGDGKSGTVYINVTGSRPNVTTSEHTNIKKRSIKLVGNVFVYEDSPDIIDVFWTKNEEKVESEERTRINKPTLTLKKISSEDAGQYQLTATNAIGSTTSNVIVLGKPDIFFERPVMKTDGSQWFPVTIQAIPAPFSVVWSAKKSDGEWFIPVDIDTCDFQRTTNAFPHPMLVVKGEQMENYTYQLEVENFIGRTIKKTSGRKFFKKKNAGIRFVHLSKYLAENFPADKLLNLKYILGASGKVTNRNSLRDADTVLKCFIVLQEENIFTQQDVIFMQFLFKELDCKELYEKCIQYAQEQEALCFFEKSPDNGYQNVKFHIQGNLTDYSKNQIENITDEVAAMLECEDGDILLNGVMESASFLLVFSIKESYTHRLFILGKQDRLKLKKLNIDYIIVDKETICLDSQNDNPVKKLCEEKDAGLEFSKLSHILAKQFPKEKLQHLKDVLLASGKVGDWYSIKTADSALKCFAVLQDEVLFTRYNLLFMQFLLKETSCDTLSRKCIQFALETAREEVNILTHDQGLPPTSHLRIGRISVLLEIGILQDKMVDVLVCNGPENLQLKNGELAESLLEAAGPGLQTECDQKYPQGIQYGDLAITGGHNMKCQFLYLGSIPKWETLGTHTPLEILLEFVTKCLEEGNKHKSTKTMAFPTLGTGSLNYPPDKVAEVFTKCIQNFNQKYPKTELTLISIVVNNHRKKREIFEQAFFSALKWSNQTRSSQWTTKSTADIKLPLLNTKQYFKNLCKVTAKTPSNWTVYTSDKDLATWNFTPLRVKFKLVDLKADSETYSAVEKLALNTWKSQFVGKGSDAEDLAQLEYSNIQIINVERLESPGLFEKYWQYRKGIFLRASKKGQFKSLGQIPLAKSGEVATTRVADPCLQVDIYPGINEHYLFYATRSNTVPKICASGIDGRLCDQRFFGHGIYLAESSTKSDQDAGPRHSRDPYEKKMFIVRACLGEMYIRTDTTNRHCYNRPPCKTCHKDRCIEHDDLFDSIVVDGSWNFREFILFDRDACYPEYIITYKRV